MVGQIVHRGERVQPAADPASKRTERLGSFFANSHHHHFLLTEQYYRLSIIPRDELNYTRRLQSLESNQICHRQGISIHVHYSARPTSQSQAPFAQLYAEQRSRTTTATNRSTAHLISSDQYRVASDISVVRCSV